MVLDVFGQTVRKDACSFSAELGKSHIQKYILCIYSINIIFYRYIELLLGKII